LNPFLKTLLGEEKGALYPNIIKFKSHHKNYKIMQPLITAPFCVHSNFSNFINFISSRIDSKTGEADELS